MRVDADCLRLDITLDEVSVSLAGGALELLCDDDQVRELFARHGLQGDLDDHAALARVCDAEAARLPGIKSVSRAFAGCGIVVDVDPRREDGLRTLEDIRTTMRDPARGP